MITNRGFGTPIANISFIANTDIIVDDDDGFTTDTDTLTLRGNNADQANGLTGNNTFNADFTAAGDAVNPIVSVFDGATLLYRLRTNAVPGAAPLTFNTINFETLGGNDTVNIVNRANGTLRVNVDGGLGNDTVGVRNTTAGVTTYTPGNSTDSGSITTPNGTVQLLGTELISLTGAVAGDTLTANGTHDNDTMALQFLGGANRIWINAQSVISFSTFGTVNLSGRFGDDKINVLPVGLVGVTTVSVNGGDSTNGDSVVVSGSAGVNNVTVTPTSADAATVTGLGAVVNIGTTESFLYNGLGGDDTLSVIGSAASDTIVIDHGANADSGKVAVSSLVPVSFLGLGASGILAIDDLGGLDRLIINGNNGNDNLTVNVAGDGIIGYQSDVSSSVGGTNHVRTTTTNAIEALLLNTLDGDDNFVINPSAFFPTGVAINAGNPSSGSDRVTINGTAGNDAHVLQLQPNGDSVSGVVGGPLVLNNVEDLIFSTGSGADSLTVAGLGGQTDLKQINYFSGSDAGDTVTVTGTINVDSFQVTPQSLTDATVTANNSGTTLLARLGAAATSTLTIAGAAGVDTVTVSGTNASETITVVKAATTTVTVGTNKTINIDSATTENVTVEAGDGNDTINVSGTAASGQLLTINGGLPTSNAGAVADTLNVTLATAGTTAAVPGNAPDAGVINNPDGAINYTGIDFFNVNGAAAGANTFNIQGTHNNDTIALQFIGGNRVWVNERAVYTFATFATVNINGLFGDDKINVLPSALVGVTTINVAGGDPTASDELLVTGTAATLKRSVLHQRASMQPRSLGWERLRLTSLPPKLSRSMDWVATIRLPSSHLSAMTR